MPYNPPLSSISQFFDYATKILRHHQTKQIESVHSIQKEQMKNVRSFFDHFVPLRKKEIEDNWRLASDFHVFDYIQPDKMKLSRIIADLLNPKGGHGQQRNFLAAFIEAMMEGASASLQVTLTKLQNAVQSYPGVITVTTEAMTQHRRRMDILVDISGQKGLVIENKPWANDQPKQLDDYADEAAKRFSNGWVLIYLHGGGEVAGEDTLSDEKRQKLEGGGNFLDADYTYFQIRWLKIWALMDLPWRAQDIVFYPIPNKR